MGKLTDYNFKQLEERIKYSREHTRESFYDSLKRIEGNTLITGVGGSMVVARFLTKVLENKNNILCNTQEISHIYYNNLKNYDNEIIVSASGKSNGVKNLLKYGNINKYVLTESKKTNKEVEMLTYEVLDKEESFISLARTLVPISLLIHYYCDGLEKIEKLRDKKYLATLELGLDFEVLYDYNSITTAYFLESTFVEAGFSSIILHDKYSYCHGRSTLSSKKKSKLIYLLGNKSELDYVLLENIPKVYEHILILESKEKDSVLIDYDLMRQAYSFVYQLSKETKKDLSHVKYAPIVRNLYHFKGSM